MKNKTTQPIRNSNFLNYLWARGQRVQHENGETGTLQEETFAGPWPAYKLGWRVYFDRDYSTVVKTSELKTLKGEQMHEA